MLPGSMPLFIALRVAAALGHTPRPAARVRRK
jgi:hypothetical protein